jgi:hypothetical protein
MDRTERGEENNNEEESNDSSTEPRLSDKDDDTLGEEVEFVSELEIRAPTRLLFRGRVLDKLGS